MFSSPIHKLGNQKKKDFNRSPSLKKLSDANLGFGCGCGLNGITNIEIVKSELLDESDLQERVRHNKIFKDRKAD